MQDQIKGNDYDYKYKHKLIQVQSYFYVKIDYKYFIPSDRGFNLSSIICKYWKHSQASSTFYKWFLNFLYSIRFYLLAKTCDIITLIAHNTI